MVFLLFGKMPLFDAITTSFGTAGTGGFGIKNDSIMGYSPYIQWVVTIFMILFGVNFNAYYFIFLKEFKKAFSIEEVRCYFLIIFISILLLAYNDNSTFCSSSPVKDAKDSASAMPSSISSSLSVPSP